MTPGRAVRYALGVLILAACLYFLVLRFIETGDALVEAGGKPGVWLGVAAAGAGYGFLLLLLVAAWSTTLGAAVDGGVRFRQAVWVYGLSTLAKYLPGNVFHLAGRQALAARLGWPQGAVAGASAVELLLHVVVVAALAAGLLLVGEAGEEGLRRLVETSGLERWWWAAVAVAALALAAVWAPAVRKRIGGLRRLDLRRVAVAAGLQLCFFAGNVAIFWIAYDLIAEGGAAMPALAGAAYLASWLIGFLTPGAPGGLGVREAAFVFVSAPAMSGADALTVAVFMRFVTTLGEALLALGAQLWARPEPTA